MFDPFFESTPLWVWFIISYIPLILWAIIEGYKDLHKRGKIHGRERLPRSKTFWKM